MSEILILIIVTTSSDFRIHADGGYFVDVRVGHRNGRQMAARNPGTLADALAFVEQVKAAPRHGHEIRFEVDDQVSGTRYAYKGL